MHALNTADIATFNFRATVAILSVDVVAGGRTNTHTHCFDPPHPLSSPSIISSTVYPQLSLSPLGSKFVVEAQAKAFAASVRLHHPVGVCAYESDNGFLTLPRTGKMSFVTLEDFTGGT